MSATLNFRVLSGSVTSDLSPNRALADRRIVLPQASTQRLIMTLAQLELCWVVEDFHKTSTRTKLEFAQALKIMSDVGSDYPASKIIAIGAAYTANQVVVANPEMRNRVAEIAVPLMSDAEVRDIITCGAQLANVNFRKSVSRKIAFLSNGLPSVAHHLCLNACLAAKVDRVAEGEVVQIDEPAFRAALDRYLNESSDTLRELFEAASRGPGSGDQANDERTILQALAVAAAPGLTAAELTEIAHEANPLYSGQRVQSCISQLSSAARASILTSINGRIRYTDPIMRSFAQMYLGVEPTAPMRTLGEMVQRITARWGDQTRVEVVGSDGLTYVLRAIESDERQI